MLKYTDDRKFTWLLTLNNPELYGYTKDKVFEVMSKICVIYVYGNLKTSHYHN